MTAVETVEPFAALRIAQMRETTESLAVANDIPGLLPRVLDRVRDVLDADLAAIVLLDDEGSLAEVALPEGRGGEGLAGCIAECVPLRSVWAGEHAVRQVALPPGSLGTQPGFGPFVGAPVRLAGRAMGAVFGFRVEGSEPFTTLDELAAVTLALQTAAHLARVGGREQLQRFVLLEERHRISAELHAGIVEALTAHAREAAAAAERTSGAASEALRDLGIRLLALAGGVDDYTAALSGTARAHPLDLMADLGTLLRELVPQGVETILRVNTAPGHPPARLAEDILFIVREAVTNSVRHGSPSKVAVDLREHRGALMLAVQDDGVGLDADHHRPGIGLLVLRNRVERSAGTLNVVGVPGMGTLVHVTFDLEPPGL